MRQEDKQLLLQDLSARLPYGVMCNIGLKYPLQLQRIFVDKVDGILLDFYEGGKDYQVYLSEVKPYLRPMSSMTEDEILELYKITYDTWYCDSLYYKNEEWINFRDPIKNNNLCFKTCIWLSDINKVIDWLNAHHFDYRGLIPMNLALETPKGMYNLAGNYYGIHL